MAFLVDDLNDLIRLLDEHPEWRTELRRRLLTDELLALPAIVERLAAAQERAEQRLDTLTERVAALAAAQERTEQRLDALTERVVALAAAQERTEQRLDALTERVAALAAAQERTEQGLAELAQRVATLVLVTEVLSNRVDTLSDRMGALLGDMLEMKFEKHAHAYLSELARRLRVLDRSRLANRLDDAIDQGILTFQERHAIMLADLVAEGRRRDDQDWSTCSPRFRHTSHPTTCTGPRRVPGFSPSWAVRSSPSSLGMRSRKAWKHWPASKG